MTHDAMAIRCRGLEVSYGRVTALRGVDIDVRAGKLTTVIGPNGAGKTTLLRTLCGLERPSAGSVVVGEEPLAAGAPEEMLHRGVALVPEGRHVFPHLSVMDNLRLGAFTARRTPKVVSDRVDGVCAWFPELVPYLQRPAGMLSGGEQQMVAIARALMSAPRVLCLDEPSLGLAPKLVRRTLEMLTRMRDTGVSILLVEQFAFLALRVADHAYLLENGAVIRAGTGAELAGDDTIRRSYLGIAV